MALGSWLLIYVMLISLPRFEGADMKIQLNANMLTMHRQLDRASNVSAAVDGDPGYSNLALGGLKKCVGSAPVTQKDYDWLAIDLKEIFLISRVKVSLRLHSGLNTSIFVGSNPSVINGRDDYQCRERRLRNIAWAPSFRSFTCQPPRLASHVSVRRNYFGTSNPDKVLQICEVEVYYTSITSVGVNVTFTQGIGDLTHVVCSSTLVPNASQLLKLHWLYPNGSSVSNASHITVSLQYNSVSLSFNSAETQLGNYSCSYILNGKSRSEVVLISAPSKPRKVSAKALSASSVLVIWDGPKTPNGKILGYTLWYIDIGNHEKKSIQLTSAKTRSYTVSSLSPYTTYNITVTVTNNANVQSNHSDVFRVRTLSTTPQTPKPPAKSSLRIKSNTVQFIAPSISTDNGPVRYVDIVVSFNQTNGSLTAYTALRYSHKYYEDIMTGNNIILGSGLRKANDDGKFYTNWKLHPKTTYSIYMRVVAQVDGQGMVKVTSKPLSITTLEEYNQSSSNRDSLFPIVAIVGIIVAVVILVPLLISIFVLKRRRSCQNRMRDQSMKEPQSSIFNQVDSPYNNMPLAEMTIRNDLKPNENFTEMLNDTPRRSTSDRLLSDVLGDPEQLMNAEPESHYFLIEDNENVGLVVKTRQGQNSKTPDEIIKENFGLHTIPIGEIPDYVAALRAIGKAGFENEFESLTKVGIGLPATAFEEHEKVNRYKNIPTYDHSRVVLPIMPGGEKSQSDFIAAAFVDGHRKPNKYIAAQAPLEDTCCDFWRMIWAENVSTVVMLTALVEKAKIKCHQYWPSEDGGIAMYDVFLVTLESTSVYTDFTVRTLTVVHEASRRLLFHYHFTAWPDHDVPKSVTGVLGFIARVNIDHEQRNGPILVHCSAGVGRTGTYIAIDTVLDQSEEGQSVDIYSCVTYLRTRRAQMVQTQNQYMFIYDAVMEAVVCGKTKIPVDSLHGFIAEMYTKDPKSNLIGFKNHFKVLQAFGHHPEKLSCTAGLRSGVRTKNRYPDIVPFDQSRVILKTADSANSSYINASFVDGFRRRDAYIVTQSPLRETVNDFWQMIWEQSSNAIVMLTPLEEEGKEMCHQYWPKSDSALYGSILVEVKVETQSTDYVVRSMVVIKDMQARFVTQFHYTAWPENGRPRSTSSILSIVDQLQKWQQVNGDKVITILCK
jgi:protein tyrosine phosphatase